MIQSGAIFYDEDNGRYITVDGVGCDPKLYSCIVEEMDDTGDYEIVGRYNFTANELNHFKNYL